MPSVSHYLNLPLPLLEPSHQPFSHFAWSSAHSVQAWLDLALQPRVLLGFAFSLYLGYLLKVCFEKIQHVLNCSMSQATVWFRLWHKRVVKHVLLLSVFLLWVSSCHSSARRNSSYAIGRGEILLKRSCCCSSPLKISLIYLGTFPWSFIKKNTNKAPTMMTCIIVNRHHIQSTVKITTQIRAVNITSENFLFL